MTKLPDVIPLSDLQEDASWTASECEILTLLARGEQEIAEGVGYDLDEILAEADILLRQNSPPTDVT